MNDFVKKPHQKTSYTEEEHSDLIICEEDPIYFIEKFLKVQHPKLGAVPLILYGYQRHMVESFHKHRMVVALTSRQNGKTTVAAAYLLWRAMFFEDTKILVVANKLKQAIEIMDRIKYSYDECPDYIKCGAKEYNKTSIAFDNGSKIEAVATTADAGRGKSITILYVDEMAFLPSNIATAFWTSIQPVLSTGGSCIVTSTPRTDEDQFAQIWKGAQPAMDEYGNIEDSEVGPNGFFPICVTWREHPDRDEAWAAPFRASLGPARFQQEFECVGADTKVELKNYDQDINMSLEQLFNMLEMSN